jgi:glycosyltransferase involved in cell wall biosynthesis
MEVVLDGAIASRVLRKPHVLHYRGNTLDKPRIVFDLLTRFWTWTAEKVICISNATADIFRGRGLAAKVEVIYNAVDIGAFANAQRCDEVRSQLGAGPTDVLIGTVGRIHPRKDIATFLRAGALAAKDWENLRLVVVGSAEASEEVEYHAQMRALADDLVIAARLTWAGARRDMPQVMKALDVLVLSSRNEGFGRVVAEGMAAGVPMVLTREGALQELTQGYPLARLASPGDPLSFAQLFRPLAETRGLAVPGVAQAFSASSCAARVHAVCAGLVAAR